MILHILLTIVLVGKSSADRYLVQLIANLATVKPGTELTILLDFADPAQDATVRELNKLGVPFALHDINKLRQFQLGLPFQPCPIYDVINYQVAQNQKDDEIMPMRYYERSLFVWTEDVDVLHTAFEIFNDTTVNCDQQIDLGLFNELTRFYFYAGSSHDFVGDVFQYSKLRRHPKVESQRPGRFAFFNNDFFVKNATAVRTSHLWTPENPVHNLDEIFTDQRDFQGYSVDVTAVPWSNFVNGDMVNKDPTHVWDNFWGYEIDMLNAVGRALNFTYTIYNPANQMWGLLDTDGKWKGMVGEIATGRAEMAMSDFGFYHSRAQMMLLSTPFSKDFLTFAAPNPKPKPKTFALVNPFEPLVWVVIVLSIFVAGTLLMAIAKVEGSIQGRDFPPWDEPSEIIWLTYSHLILQNHGDTMKFVKAEALRCAISTWLMYSLLVTASYGGMLRAFLTNPEYYPKINTLADVVKSGLPWHMVSYGEDEEKIMASSPDPVIRTIWERKVTVAYDPTLDIEQVFEGKQITIDWYTGLSQSVAVRYSTPDGTPLVNVPQVSIVSAPYLLGWVFDCYVPFRSAFNKQISRVIESGLISQWMTISFHKMKEISLAKGDKPIHIEDVPDASPMGLDDLVSAFLLIGILALLSLTAFLLETAYFYFVGWTKKRNNMERTWKTK